MKQKNVTLAKEILNIEVTKDIITKLSEKTLSKINQILAEAKSSKDVYEPNEYNNMLHDVLRELQLGVTNLFCNFGREEPRIPLSLRKRTTLINDTLIADDKVNILPDDSTTCTIQTDLEESEAILQINPTADYNEEKVNSEEIEEVNANDINIEELFFPPDGENVDRNLNEAEEDFSIPIPTNTEVQEDIDETEDVKRMSDDCVTVIVERSSDDEDEVYASLLQIAVSSNSEVETRLSDFSTNSEYHSEGKQISSQKKTRKKRKNPKGTAEFSKTCSVRVVRENFGSYYSAAEVTNLLMKRKHESVDCKIPTKKTRNSKTRLISSSSSSSSSSSLAHSDDTVLYSVPQPSLDDAILYSDGNNSAASNPDDEELYTNEMRRLLETESEDDETMLESESDERRPERKKKLTKLKKSLACDVKEEDSDTDFVNDDLKIPKDNWRNDPLLRSKINSDSEEEQKRRRKLRKRDEKTPERDLPISKEIDKDKESIDDKDKDKSPENCDDNDLVDAEVINCESSSSTDLECLGEVEGKSLTPSKGRKNIRALLSDDILESATKLANKDEKERQKRLKEKEDQLTQFLSESQLSETSGLLLDFDVKTNEPLVVVDASLTKRLKPHQSDGVKFMWNACYESIKQLKTSEGSGCILAHCMGLGKTFQVTTLIHTLFNHNATKTKHVLVICPLSTVPNWLDEFKIAKTVSGVNPFDVYNLSAVNNDKKTRLRYLANWRTNGGVFVIGYEAYCNLLKPPNKQTDRNLDPQVIHSLRDPGPDLLICDEGHLLKNGKNTRYQTIAQIRTRRRIILTGTPMQNNLTEYYHMVHLVKRNLLGNYTEYLNRFNNPITNGQYDDSTERDIKIMKLRSHVLHRILENTVQRYEDTELHGYLPEKLDYALYINIHEVQANLYRKYLTALENSTDSYTKRKLLTHYHGLAPIWTHPYVGVYKKEKKKGDIESFKLGQEADVAGKLQISSQDWYDDCPPDSSERLEYGAKFVVLMSIIEECMKINEKVLVFSLSLNVLDAVEHFLSRVSTDLIPWIKGDTYLRLDGQVPGLERTFLINKFNKTGSKVKLFLLTNRVGGLGLNLVAANRVILLDVSWNPSHDLQSIFRVYRFGQEKKCYIYRLVARGTMEEVVYRRSVTKLAIAGRVIDEQQIDRHYKSIDLQEVYRFKYDKDEIRPIPKVPVDNLLANLLQRHEAQIFSYTEHQSLLLNKPDEGLNDEEMKLAWSEFNSEQNRTKELVKNVSGPFPVGPATTIGCYVGTPPNIQTSTIYQHYYNSMNNTSNFGPSTSANSNNLKSQISQNLQNLKNPKKTRNLIQPLLNPTVAKPPPPNNNIPTNNFPPRSLQGVKPTNDGEIPNVVLDLTLNIAELEGESILPDIETTRTAATPTINTGSVVMASNVVVTANNTNNHVRNNNPPTIIIADDSRSAKTMPTSSAAVYLPAAGLPQAYQRVNHGSKRTSSVISTPATGPFGVVESSFLNNPETIVRNPVSGNINVLIPVSSNRNVVVPVSSSRNPLVPVSSNRNVTVPVSSSRNPLVSVSTSRNPTMPVSTSRNAAVPSGAIGNVFSHSTINDITNFSTTTTAATSGNFITSVSTNRNPTVPISANQTPIVPFSTNRTPIVPYSTNRTSIVPYSTNRTPIVPYSTNRTPIVPYSTNRTPIVPYSTNITPIVPSSTNRYPTASFSSTRSPTVPFSTNRYPTVPISTNQTPIVPFSTNRTPTVPIYSNRNPTVPIYGNRNPTVPIYGNRNPTVPIYGNRNPVVPISTNSYPIGAPFFANSTPRLIATNGNLVVPISTSSRNATVPISTARNPTVPFSQNQTDKSVSRSTAIALISAATSNNSTTNSAANDTVITRVTPLSGAEFNKLIRSTSNVDNSNNVTTSGLPQLQLPRRICFQIIKPRIRPYIRPYPHPDHTYSRPH